MRGGTDLGFLVKIKDARVKSGQRVFKIKVDGGAKKAEIAGFGAVDMQGEWIHSSLCIHGALGTFVDYSGTPLIRTP